jgi:hypothetical protein
MADSLICSVAGCGKTAKARGYCNSHYKRLINYGDPLVVKRRDKPNNCQKQKCPAVVILNNHMLYVQNSDSKKEKNKKWAAANPEWCLQNKTKWNNINRELVRSRGRIYMAERRARKMQAMPSWLTSDHISQINAVYAEARRLSVEAGVPHEVDHIVPLQGRVVCGLHVPWNLRAIPWDENRRRPRIYKDGMD